MSKLGKKLNIIISGAVVLMLFILLGSLLVLIYKNSTALIEKQLTADVEVFKASVNSHIDRSAKIAEYWSSVGMDVNALESGDFSIIEKAWETQAETENDFCAILDVNGNVAWKTPNFDLVSYDAQNIISSGSSVRGLFKGENVPISARYMGPVIKDDSNIGAIIVGFDLDEVEYLDELKEQTGAQVTIFAGKTRYATTVTNADGTRAVGTDMAENVEETVIKNGMIYKGTAEILGERHYVLYEPIYDYDNDVIGAYFAGYSAEDVYAMLRGVILTAIICAVITVVILSFVIMVIVRRFIEKPLRAVEIIAGNMQEGRFSVPDSKFNFANDEMGSFARKMEDTKQDLNMYIGDISRVLDNMAKGDFSIRSNTVYTGDFARINESFDKIRSTLKEIIVSMNGAAEDVMAGAGQMADGSQILADGTIKQATAIDQLSTTITSISEHVEHSAENSAKANKLSQQSVQKIDEQNEDINNMMTAMQVIMDKSNKISNIIQTIDDIAFQTNILALNATVEAAHAGEAGKGFAVVADEVRNLAAKSAEAAKSTADLISSTIEAVTGGAKIAEETAATMKDVMDISNRTNELISEISEATALQAVSIKEVTQGINEISVVVQQNSATAQESAASCEQLSGQSQILKQQVARLSV